MVSGSRVVGQDLVELSSLERSRIVVVVDADSESGGTIARSFHGV
jgi:hypothetical protein